MGSIRQDNVVVVVACRFQCLPGFCSRNQYHSHTPMGSIRRDERRRRRRRDDDDDASTPFRRSSNGVTVMMTHCRLQCLPGFCSRNQYRSHIPMGSSRHDCVALTLSKSKMCVVSLAKCVSSLSWQHVCCVLKRVIKILNCAPAVW